MTTCSSILLQRQCTNNGGKRTMIIDELFLQDETYILARHYKRYLSFQDTSIQNVNRTIKLIRSIYTYMLYPNIFRKCIHNYYGRIRVITTINLAKS